MDESKSPEMQQQQKEHNKQKQRQEEVAELKKAANGKQGNGLVDKSDHQDGKRNGKKERNTQKQQESKNEQISKQNKGGYQNSVFQNGDDRENGLDYQNGVNSDDGLYNQNNNEGKVADNELVIDEEPSLSLNESEDEDESLELWEVERLDALEQKFSRNKITPNLFYHHTDEAVIKLNAIPTFGLIPEINKPSKQNKFDYWPMCKYTAFEFYRWPIVKDNIKVALKIHNMLLNIVLLGHLYALPFVCTLFWFNFISDCIKLQRKFNSMIISPVIMSLLIYVELRFLTVWRYFDARLSLTVKYIGEKLPFLKWSFASFVNYVSLSIEKSWLWINLMEPIFRIVGVIPTVDPSAIVAAAKS